MRKRGSRREQALRAATRRPRARPQPDIATSPDLVEPALATARPALADTQCHEGQCGSVDRSPSRTRRATRSRRDRFESVPSLRHRIPRCAGRGRCRSATRVSAPTRRSDPPARRVTSPASFRRRPTVVHRNAAPVVAAQALLANGMSDDTAVAYVQGAWRLHPIDARAAVAAAHTLAGDHHGIRIAARPKP